MAVVITLGDGRQVIVEIDSADHQTEVIFTIEAKSQNQIDLQRASWQAILNNFKHHTENN